MVPFFLSLFVAGDHISSPVFFPSFIFISPSLPFLQGRKKKVNFRNQQQAMNYKKAKPFLPLSPKSKKEKDIVWEPFPCRLTGNKKEHSKTHNTIQKFAS